MLKSTEFYYSEPSYQDVWKIGQAENKISGLSVTYSHINPTFLLQPEYFSV